MLSKKQEEQYISFVANFVRLLREETDMTRHQAQVVVTMAASTLLGAVFHVQPDQDAAMNAFVAKVIRTAVQREYERQA